VPDKLNRSLRKNGSPEFPLDDSRVKRIVRTIDSYQRNPDALIQVFHYVQDIYGYLPLDMIAFVSREMRVPPSRAYGVATFYHYFSLKPKGKHNCLVCTGTACYVKGSQKIIDQIGKEFSIKPGETTPDNRLGLQVARCIGSCGLAPAVVLDNDILAKVSPTDVIPAIMSRIGGAK